MLTLVKYGFNNAAEMLKMEWLEKKDILVLIQNGVFWAVSPKIDELIEEGVEVFAIEDDFLARGYKKEDTKVNLISYEDFVDLIEKSKKIVT